jgi:hypothetical protein
MDITYDTIAKVPIPAHVRPRFFYDPAGIVHCFLSFTISDPATSLWLSLSNWLYPAGKIDISIDAHCIWKHVSDMFHIMNEISEHTRAIDTLVNEMERCGIIVKVCADRYHPFNLDASDANIVYETI